jgi:catabolite regulation protein CreA
LKTLRIVRKADRPRTALNHLSCADRVIEGSAQNRATAAPTDRATPIPTS